MVINSSLNIAALTVPDMEHKRKLQLQRQSQLSSEHFHLLVPVYAVLGGVIQSALAQRHWPAGHFGPAGQEVPQPPPHLHIPAGRVMRVAAERQEHSPIGRGSPQGGGQPRCPLWRITGVGHAAGKIPASN